MTRPVLGLIGVLLGTGAAALGWYGLRYPTRLLRSDLAGEYRGYRRFQLWELRIGGALMLAVGVALAVAGWFVPLPQGL